MHALATLLCKNLRRAREITDLMTEHGYCDYCSIGGRYHHLIPVNKKVKDYTGANHGMLLTDEPNYPYGYNNPRLEEVQYVDAARIRNIRNDIVMDMANNDVLNILNPHVFIIDTGNGYDWVDEEDQWDTIRSFMNQPNRSYWFAVVIDYHY